MRILALALALTAAEWLRGHVLTGFPWNTFGYALTGPLVLAQASALIGLWGLTFFAVWLFASPAVLADERARHAAAVAAVLIPLVLLARLRPTAPCASPQSPTQFVAGVKLRIMQPNLAQDEKFNYGARQQVMARYLALSDRATGPGATGVRDVTHLIWPESAFPFFLAREAEALAQIADLLPPGTVLIVGAARARIGRADARHDPRLQFDLRDRSRRRDPVGLRQGASRAVRRISAVPGFPRTPRPDAAHQGARRLHPGHGAQADVRAARARRSCR